MSAVSAAPERAITQKFGIDPAQIPTWSSEDLNFFLHGSLADQGRSGLERRPLRGDYGTTLSLKKSTA